MFTTQTTYNSIIQRMKDRGFELCAQVQITTDDFEWFVEAEEARTTTLVFHIPALACFVRLQDSQAREKDNHCFESLSAVVSVGSLSTEDLLMAYRSRFDWDADPYLDRYEEMTTFDWIGTKSTGWSSGHYANEQRIIEDHTDCWGLHECSHQDLLKGDSWLNIICNSIERIKPYIAAQFEELSPDWEPTYVFSPQPYDSRTYYGADGLQARIRSLYWERFGNARSVLREKIKRIR